MSDEREAARGSDWFRRASATI